MLLSAPGLSSATASSPTFKLLVESDGAYRVGFEDLELGDNVVASESLELSTGGAPVPIWVEDGGDGMLGPGDWFEFVGTSLRGEVSHSSEHSRFNVYFLRSGAPSPHRMRAGGTERLEHRTQPRLRTLQHLEQDKVLPRIPPRPGIEIEELWFWAKLFQGDRGRFVHELDLADLDPGGEASVALRVHLRGWSKPRRKPDPGMADHRIEVELNGVAVGSSEWDGTDPHLVEIPPVPASSLKTGPNQLTLEVPTRAGDAGENLVDVVMLNWIEIDYPVRPVVGDRQTHVRFDGDSPQGALQLEGEDGEPFLVYGDKASRWLGDRPQTVWTPVAGERSFVVSPVDRLLRPAAIHLDRPSSLAATTHRADYIIVAHRRLIEAIEPLAELHRSRGLAVEVVDIEDVYDEFNSGVVHPRALRDFLSHAYHEWRPPAPRFVLLVGDASWDAKNSAPVDSNYADWTYRPGEGPRFVKNSSTPYPDSAESNHRGLIPTWNHASYQGHAASDNYFVAVNGDDFLPDMAIGRLPVVEPAEVEAIVEKTIGYVTAPGAGAWRRDVLLITNESVGLQRQSDRLAATAAGLGLRSEKIYPVSSETSNERHSERLIELLNQGQLVVHFVGHGGRYIWRTGPPDLNKNHDLFTLDHIDRLDSTDRLPVVLSLTCYSAPFDHPSADSIGEKFLRAERRGAVAVLAASWRNSPQPRWGSALLEELTAPGATAGEAVQRAKHTIGNRMFVETYNLLGDPAVPVATRRPAIALRVDDATGASLEVSGVVEVESFAGNLVVELVGSDGEVVVSTALEIHSPVFEVTIDRPEAEVQAVRARAVGAHDGVDAAGGLLLVTEPERPRRMPRALSRPAGGGGSRR